jgi:hypothetical protein
MDPHLSLFGRWLMLPVVIGGLLEALRMQGRFELLNRYLNGEADLCFGVCEVFGAIVLAAVVIPVSFYNSYILFVKLYL